MRTPRAWFVGLFLLFAALAHGAAGNPRIEALRMRIETLRTEGDAHIGAGSPTARALLAAVYERRGFAPLWTDARRVGALRNAIDASTTHGLEPRDYHAGTLPPSLPAAHSPDHFRAAEQDLLLTEAFMRFAYHLRFGKSDPRTLQACWNFARTLKGVDPVAALSNLLTAPDPAAALEGLAPGLPMYGKLRRALERLREAEGRGGWPRVDHGPMLKLGSAGQRVSELRRRLRASGDLGAAGEESLFDASLEQAVQRFQARHGLETDGVVGPATLAELNTSVADRIAQVRANLERLRWVARELQGDYLLVDIAGYTAQLWVNDTLAWSARAVIGQPYRMTPEFRAPLKYVVLNPEWNVPPNILRRDVLPKVVQDMGHLERNRMRVLDHIGQRIDPSTIDWSRFRSQPRTFPYQIVQAPGPENPLGRIKFMFPNEHSVYLHDTPSRALFDRTVRAFSSGCIRIEKPLELARLLLDDPERWSEEQLQDAISTGKTLTVPVRRAVPVLLLYFTAVSDDDRLQFRPDLYKRDDRIIKALSAPFRFAPVDSVH